MAAEYFAATPAALFLANPLGKSFEPKPRKEIVRSKRRENVSHDVCPRLRLHPWGLLTPTSVAVNILVGGSMFWALDQSRVTYT